MALPLIYLVGAGVLAVYASKKKQAAGDPLFDPPSSNPLLNQGTGLTRGGLKIASQLQRDRFTGKAPTAAVTPPTNYYTQGGVGGKPIGFR